MALWILIAISSERGPIPTKAAVDALGNGVRLAILRSSLPREGVANYCNVQILLASGRLLIENRKPDPN